ncbi:MAG TPA: tetratricopeptide repeat protein, partial [Planctomycetes bacterium]|nr:tetratricopeptide repeat protein [Planctomycetota bacterium]
YLAHVNLGYIDHREGKLDAAEAHYRQALEDAPRMADAHTNLAGIELARGRSEEARASLDAALAADPGFVNAWLLYGVLEEQEGHPEEALARRARAFQVDPNSVSAGVEYARSLLATGRTNEALAVLGPLASDHPNHIDAQVTLARAESAAGRDGAARDRLERLLGRADPAVATELAWVLATSPDASVRDPARALRLARGIDEPDWRALRSLAAALAGTGAREEARSVLLDAAAAAPTSATATLMELRGRIDRGEALR